jgi:ArsR family transcriptional regulator, arsenate/arsenite/antimonite-responsive transcriptional repressor
MKNKALCEKIFKALSNESRLEILSLLTEHQFCVNALTSRLNISQAVVSQHLKILETAGLVKKRKEGYWIHYALAPEGFEPGYMFLGKMCKTTEKKTNAAGRWRKLKPQKTKDKK